MWTELMNTSSCRFLCGPISSKLSPVIKMITKREAIEKVKKSLSEDQDVITDTIIEKEYGWVIFSQSKDYIATGDEAYLLIGSGGTLVERESGKLYEFGSAYSTEQNLKAYELGYLQYEYWDIGILNVRNIEDTIQHLLELDICYVTPEEESGVVWKIPREYTASQLRKKLEVLPARFCLGRIYFSWELLESFKRQSDFEYKLSENKGHENSV